MPPCNIIAARSILALTKLIYCVYYAKFISKDPSIIYKTKASVYYYS